MPKTIEKRRALTTRLRRCRILVPESDAYGPWEFAPAMADDAALLSAGRAFSDRTEVGWVAFNL
jgi:hypothetical protein